MLEGRILCDELITSPGIPTECNVSESDGKASTVKRPWPTRGCHTTKKQNVFVENFFSESATLRG
jgi:hypothetical protein